MGSRVLRPRPRADLRRVVRRRRGNGQLSRSPFRIPNLLRDLCSPRVRCPPRSSPRSARPLRARATASCLAPGEQSGHDDHPRARRACAFWAWCFPGNSSALLAPGFDAWQSRASPRTAHADHVSFHSAGVARGAGHGHAEREEHLRQACHGVEFFQSGIHRRRRRAGLAVRSDVRAAGR